MNKNLPVSLFVGLTATAVILPTSCALAQEKPATPNSVALSSLDISGASQEWGTPQKNKGVTGEPLSVGGQTFAGAQRKFECSILEISKINSRSHSSIGAQFHQQLQPTHHCGIGRALEH